MATAARILRCFALAGFTLLLCGPLASASMAAGTRTTGSFPPKALVTADSTRFIDPDELDAYIEQFMTEYHIPGVVACVVKSDRLAWTGVYGYADIVADVPAADSTLFMLASISKTFVATALMQCWENGLIGLDSDINSYLPFDVINPNHPSEIITPRQLLTHTSSIARNDDWVSLIVNGADSPLELGQFLEDWLVPGGLYYSDAHYAPYAPGTGGQYCNVAFSLAGYLVECVSGHSLEAFCQENIFEPLGMGESSWFLANLDPAHIAMPTAYSGGAYQQYGHFGIPIYPAGQLRTSAPQLARHLEAFMELGNYNGIRILEPETVEMMRTVQFPDVPVVDGLDFGLGWYRSSSVYGYIWGHSGGFTGVTTFMYCNLEEDWGIILLINTDYNDGANFITNVLFSFAHNYVVTAVEPTEGPVAPLLIQNYPNPFNPLTTIRFSLAHAAEVDLQVFDVHGRTIRRLIDNQPLSAGRHEATWDGRDSAGKQQASSMYYYRLEAGDFSETRKMILLK